MNPRQKLLYLLKRHVRRLGAVALSTAAGGLVCSAILSLQAG
jgi:hypothetical protein